MDVISKITERQLKTDLPEFRVGDTVRVGVMIKEGKRERLQNFEGIVVARKGGGISETFTVRKESGGIGVNRTFPVHSPRILEFDVIKKGKVRRVKLINTIRKSKGEFKIKERGRN